MVATKTFLLVEVTLCNCTFDSLFNKDITKTGCQYNPF